MSLNVAGVRLGRLSHAEVQELLKEARSMEVTYDHVGSTFDGKGRSRTTVLGYGDADFVEAAGRLKRWAPQRGIGARVHPDDAPVEVGTTILVELRGGPVRVLAPCRAVRVIDEADRFGFAYGTLPGHPEKGEESFLVERGDDDSVTGTVTVDAVPGTLAAQLAVPVVYGIQRWAVRRYLSALVVR